MPRVGDDLVPERMVPPGTPDVEPMPSPQRMVLRVMDAVPPLCVGRVTLERTQKSQPQRKGNGEQQYEQANNPQQERELPSMGAAVAECGRSLSA